MQDETVSRSFFYWQVTKNKHEGGVFQKRYDKMDYILADLSTPALTNSIQANLFSFFRYMQHSPHTTFQVLPRLVRWHTGIGHPWFNGALNIQPAVPDEDQQIQETLAFFHTRHINTFTWWLEAGLSATWGPHLLARGFRYDASTPGMAIDLQMIPEKPTLPANLRIVPVMDGDMLRIWNLAFLAGYELPFAWESSFYKFLTGLGLALPVRHYLGYLEDMPVATSSLYLGAGVAGVMFVATIPEARGRGLGSAMTLAPLQEARALGYRAGILQSSEMGYKVYQRLGFQKLCNIDNYYWTSETA